MSVPDTAVSMAATLRYPYKPQGRNWVTPASTAMPTNLRQYNLREINCDRGQSLRRICSRLQNFAQQASYNTSRRTSSIADVRSTLEFPRNLDHFLKKF